jgi:hypothetical protein
MMRGLSLVARMEEKRNVYMVLVEKPKGKRLLGRPRRRCLNLDKGLAHIMN